MPIYEYECDRCGHRLEAFQKLNDPPLVQCPACSEDGLRKLVSAAGFRLKGTGWYATDFKDKGKPKPAAGATEAKEDGKPAAAETKSDAASSSAASTSSDAGHTSSS
jgi:putative FmdB family regulatory protein